MIQARAGSSALQDFVRLGRPQFLIGGFLMHGLGVAIARSLGAPFDPVAFLWAQLAITATQLMTHYSNEYFDLAADRANLTPTRWAGGSRVLVDGRVSPRMALVTALVLAGLALTCALVLALVIRPTPITFALFAVPLFLAWSYSAPPLQLHSRGLGELTTALLVPGAATLIGFWLQAGRFDLLPILVAVPLCLLQFGMLLLIELPDCVGDAAVGKCTLVVRLGPEAAARLYLTVLAATYVALPLLVILGLPPLVAAADLLGLPVAAWIAWQLAHGAWAEPARWEALSFFGIALLIGTAAADLAVFTLWPDLTPKIGSALTMVQYTLRQS
jgi:1,4-dihydroxy-2-naphthoate octaprenyltransferase